jgi:hypothetical protein
MWLRLSKWVLKNSASLWNIHIWAIFCIQFWIRLRTTISYFERGANLKFLFWIWIYTHPQSYCKILWYIKSQSSSALFLILQQILLLVFHQFHLSKFGNFIIDTEVILEDEWDNYVEKIRSIVMQQKKSHIRLQSLSLSWLITPMMNLCKIWCYYKKYLLIPFKYYGYVANYLEKFKTLVKSMMCPFKRIRDHFP